LIDHDAVKSEMKNGKPTGSSNIVGEMLKASDDISMRLIFRLMNAVIKEYRVTDEQYDYEYSTILYI